LTPYPSSQGLSSIAGRAIAVKKKLQATRGNIRKMPILCRRDRFNGFATFPLKPSSLPALPITDGFSDHLGAYLNG